MLSFLFSFILYNTIPAYLPNEMMDKNSAVESEMMFRNIHIDGNKGRYIVTGEAKMNNRKIFYSVEDGHVEYIQGEQLVVKDQFSNWTTFKIIIEIPSTKLPTNGSLILNLYEHTSTGEKTHSYPVILEKFYNK